MIYSDMTPDEHLQALKSSSHPPSAYKLQGRELTAGLEVLITWWLSPVHSPAHPSHRWPHGERTKHKGHSDPPPTCITTPVVQFQKGGSGISHTWEESRGGMLPWGSSPGAAPKSALKQPSAGVHWAAAGGTVVTSPSSSPIHSNSSWSCFFSKSASFPLKPQKQPGFLSTRGYTIVSTTASHFYSLFSLLSKHLFSVPTKPERLLKLAQQHFPHL